MLKCYLKRTDKYLIKSYTIKIQVGLSFYRERSDKKCFDDFIITV